jgi:hypothetical protein
VRGHGRGGLDAAERLGNVAAGVHPVEDIADDVEVGCGPARTEEDTGRIPKESLKQWEGIFTQRCELNSLTGWEAPGPLLWARGVSFSECG